MRTRLRNIRKNYHGKLDNMAKFNAELLTKEDKMFLEWEYKKSLARYISANQMNIENDLRVNSEDSKKVAKTKRENLEKARQWAVKEALEATFHQKSIMANWLNEGEKKVLQTKFGKTPIGGALFKMAMGAKIPFKRTPINIAKTAVEYSPFGLAGSTIGAITDATTSMKNIEKDFNARLGKLQGRLNDGKIGQERYNTLREALVDRMNQEKSEVVNERIDKISKGITGTTLAVVGAILANTGFVKIKGASDDDEDEFLENMTGEQQYSLTIGDINIPIDWLAPRYYTITCRC